ncbi:MAG: flagellar protein FliT [Pseudomonadota bacterium]
MMSAQEVLSVYQAMAELTEQMVTAAGQSDWDRLVLLEQHCARHVATLKAHEPAQALSGAGRQKKIDLIKKLLADDRAIRDLTAPWMTQLSALINNTGTERRLAHAYGA